jgi:hypothetical protein
MFRVFTAACLLLACSARARDLFSFMLGRHVFAFVVADASPIPATVGQERAAQAGLEWAQWYYGTADLYLLSIELRREPTRFWLIELMAEGARVYAVVLPDGRVVQPVRREQL